MSEQTGPTGLVVVASTRAATGEYDDRSGAVAVNWLRDRGVSCPDAVVVADADIPRYLGGLLSARAELPDVLITSGGTGVSASDVTVETVRPHLDKELPGIVQEFFRRGVEKFPAAALSGAVAGTVGHTFVMTLPGSPGGVKDGLATLDPVLDHLLELLRHDTPAGSSDGTPVRHPAKGQAQDPDYVRWQTGKVLAVRITDQPLGPLLEQARGQVVTPAMGAVVTFEGVVRDHDEGERVRRLTYSAHPDAERMLGDVVGRVVELHPEVRAWVAHRVGDLAIGDLAFAVAVAAAHRGPAFAAAGEIADRVKSEVPIWKEQEMEDGTTTWVGL